MDFLFAGQFIQAFLQVWADAGVPSDILALIFLTLGVTLIYIKTKEIGLVSVTLLVTSNFLISFVTPVTQIYFGALLVFGMIGMIYSFYKGR